MSTVRAATIVTVRLALVPLQLDHADELAGALSDPELHTFTGGEPAGGEAKRARFTRLLAGPADPRISWCNWAILLVADGRLVGTMQATIGAGDDEVAEIAWVVGTPWQRQGIATEAARALVEWLTHDSARTVVAHIHPDHRASAAVASAAGLIPTDEWLDGEVTWRLPRPQGEF